MMDHSELDRLNRADDSQAADMLLPMIERAGELAVKVAAHRPFSSPEALAERISAHVHALDDVDAITLFRGHPELAPEVPDAMTTASQSEQARLGLDRDNAPVELADMNARYSARFGFPFILALHEHRDVTTVMAALNRRINATRAEEIAENKEQICSVSRARVFRAFAQDPETAS